MYIKPLTPDYEYIMIEDRYENLIQYRVNEEDEYLSIKRFPKTQYQIFSCEVVENKEKVNINIIFTKYSDEKDYFISMNKDGIITTEFSSKNRIKRNNLGIYYTENIIYNSKKNELISFENYFQQKSTKTLNLTKTVITQLESNKNYLMAKLIFDTEETIHILISIENNLKILSILGSEMTNREYSLTPELKWLDPNEFMELFFKSDLFQDICKVADINSAIKKVKQKKIETSLFKKIES